MISPKRKGIKRPLKSLSIHQKKRKKEEKSLTLQREIKQLENVETLQLQKTPKPFLFQMLKYLNSIQKSVEKVRETLNRIFLSRIATLRDDVLLTRGIREHIFTYLRPSERETLGWQCCTSFRLHHIRNETFKLKKHRMIANCRRRPLWSFMNDIKKDEGYGLFVTRSEKAKARIAGFCCNDLYLVFLYSSPMYYEEEDEDKISQLPLGRSIWEQKGYLAPSFSVWTLEIRSSFGDLFPVKRIDLTSVIIKNMNQDKDMAIETSNVVIQMGKGKHEVIFVLFQGIPGVSYFSGCLFGFSARTAKRLFSLDSSFFYFSHLATSKNCCCGQFPVEPHSHREGERTPGSVLSDSFLYFLDFGLSMERKREIRLLVLMWLGNIYELTFPSLRVRLVFCAECQRKIWPTLMNSFFPIKLCIAKLGRLVVLHNCDAESTATFRFCILRQDEPFRLEKDQGNLCFESFKRGHGFYFEKLYIAVLPRELSELSETSSDPQKIQRVFWRESDLVLQTNQFFWILPEDVINKTYLQQIKKDTHYDDIEDCLGWFQRKSSSYFWVSLGEEFSIRFCCQSNTCPTMVLDFGDKNTPFLIYLPSFLNWNDFLESYCICANNHSLFVGWRQSEDISEFYFCVYEFLKPVYLSSQKRIYECGSLNKQSWWTQFKPSMYFEVDSLVSTFRKSKKESKKKDARSLKPKQTKQTSILRYFRHRQPKKKSKNSSIQISENEDQYQSTDENEDEKQEQEQEQEDLISFTVKGHKFSWEIPRICSNSYGSGGFDWNQTIETRSALDDSSEEDSY